MKFTKVLVAAAIFATTSLFAFTPVFAQECDGNCPPPPPPPHGDRMEKGERPPHPEHKDRLNLTDEQKAQMKDRMNKRGDHKDFKGHKKHHHRFGEGLNLTDEQKAQIQKINEWEKAESKKIITDEQKAKVKEIRKKAKADRMNVLTDEQKKQMEEMKANKHRGHHGHGHHPRMHKGNERYRGVELTEDQKTQFKAIDEKARKDFENILTDEQKKALDEAKNRRPHHER